VLGPGRLSASFASVVCRMLSRNAESFGLPRQAQESADGPLLRFEIVSEPQEQSQNVFSFHPFNLFSQMPSVRYCS